MRNAILTTTLFFLLLRTVSAQTTIDPSFELYILIGQSNMSGRGSLTKEFQKEGHPRVFMLSKDLQWEPAKHPLHFDKPKAAAVGPGLAFGVDMAKANAKVKIGLIPCAVGGTAIENWQPGAFDKATQTHPYDDAVARIKVAMKSGIVKGVIWHQGEANSSKEKAKSYLLRLNTLIGRIRAEVGNPELPFIVGELGRYRNSYEVINEELAKVPSTIQFTGLASSEDLRHKGDSTHFDGRSANLLGHRFAERMRELQTVLPDSIYSGKQGKFHVQGVAVDKANGYVYFSFTDRLIKTDLSGKLIGSVTGFAGHLGDLDFNEDDGKIYGSLEYKSDAIGKGISKSKGLEANGQNAFYIAVFDGAAITRAGMNAEEGDLLRTIYIAEAVKDYEAGSQSNKDTKAHRFGCSGIDGVAFAPEIGSSNLNKKYLYVAYGIHGDTTRSDNDYQVLLKYDVVGWGKYAQKLSQHQLHRSGPKRPLDKFFVKTGNTRYGIQNLAYDSYSGNFFAAVYRGTKEEFPNYDLFVIDTRQKAATDQISFDDKSTKIKTLSLLHAGPADADTGIRGWYFKWGATGICPLGSGLFYISHNKKDSDGQEHCTLYKYKWVGDAQNSFVRVQN